MKKRIISLVLIIVMAAGLLVSCGYNLATDDMSKYTDFDEAAFNEFKTLLQNIEILDADFTSDGDMENGTRAKKLLDAIFTSLTSVAEKKEAGKIAYYDTLYYCYYVTFKDGDSNVTDATTVYADKMAISSATKLYGESGADTDSIAYKIFKAVMDGFEFKSGDNYYTYTSTAPTVVKAGDKVMVTYTKTFTAKDATEATEEKVTTAVELVVSDTDLFTKNFIDKSTGKQSDITIAAADAPDTKDGIKYTDVKIESVVTKAQAGDTVSITYKEEYVATGASKETTSKYTNKIVVLEAGNPIHDKIIGQKPGSIEKFTLADASTKEGKNYTEVKLNWIKKGGKEVTLTDTTYDDTSKQTAVDGTEVDLKNKELTYHIFPVYFTDTPDELTWEHVIYDIFGTGISSSILDCFEDEENKNDGKTLKELIDGIEGDKDFVDLATLIANAKNATEADDKEATDAGMKTADLLLEERKNLITSLVKAKSLEDTITKEYKEYRYDSLEATYNNQIRTNIAKEIQDIIAKNVVMKNGGNTLPEDLVNEVYDNLMKNHKRTFYTGSSTVEVDGKNTSVSHYKQNNGSFDKYLVSVFTDKDGGPANMKEAEALVMEDAKEFVTYLVKLYAVSAYYDCVISDKEYKEMTYDDTRYQSYVDSFGDIGFRAAYQFEKLYGKLIIIEGEQEAIDAYEAEVEKYNKLSAAEKEKTKAPEYDFDFDYVSGMIPFENVKYKFKAD